MQAATKRSHTWNPCACISIILDSVSVVMLDIRKVSRQRKEATSSVIPIYSSSFYQESQERGFRVSSCTNMACLMICSQMAIGGENQVLVPTSHCKVQRHCCQSLPSIFPVPWTNILFLFLIRTAPQSRPSRPLRITRVNKEEFSPNLLDEVTVVIVEIKDHDPCSSLQLIFLLSSVRLQLLVPLPPQLPHY